MIEHKDTPVLLLKGGGGSSKSYSTSQYIINVLCMQRSNLKIVIGRKYRPQLKITAQQSIMDRLEELHKFGWRWYENKTDNYIKFRGNKIYFLSLEDITKIQSVESNIVWLEEGTELDFQTFNHLYSRNRVRNTGVNQVIMTFNPIDAKNYIKTRIIDPGIIPCALHHSNYLDNPFLNPQSVQVYKNYETLDPHFYRIYTLGEWGTLENIIFKNWDTIDEFPKDVKDIYYGLDFGWTHASACVKIGEKEDDIYIEELFYQTELTNDMLIDKLKRIKEVVYCDSAEPDRIQALKDGGIFADEAYKGKGSVNAGIIHLRGKRIHITKSSPHVISEIEGYSHRELRDGTILDEPIKVNDHAMDAMRYGVFSRYKNVMPGISYIDLGF